MKGRHAVALLAAACLLVAALTAPSASAARRRRPGSVRAAEDADSAEGQMRANKLESLQARIPGREFFSVKEARKIDLDFWRNYDMEEFEMEDCDIDRRSGLSAEEFLTEYVLPNKPVILTEAMNDWPAMTEWRLPVLVKNYKDHILDTGVDKREFTVKEYAKYMKANGDPKPFYVFDKWFFVDYPEFNDDYTPPGIFPPNLWSRLPEEYVPPSKWLVLGPTRSGSGWHTDPYNSSAWNALVQGRKRWALYSPETYRPPGVYGAEMEESMYFCATPDSGCDAMPVIEWFRQTRPFLSAAAKPVECVQREGEIIFVPTGWWHTVLNLEPTVAVTENFVNVGNHRQAFDELKKAAMLNPKLEFTEMASAYYNAWKDDYPHLFSAADEEFYNAIPRHRRTGGGA